jgi:Fe-S cluster assembly protein SufD
MKEPVVFKEALAFPTGVTLSPDRHAYTEWTEPCELGPTGIAAGGFEIVGQAGADTEYVIHQGLPADTRAATRIRVRLERDATVRLIVIQEGAAASHLEIEGVCAGDGSNFEIRGLQNTRGKQRHSIQASVRHEGSHTKSDMKVWCIGRDQGHSIFNGMIDIKPGARDIEAYQRNKNLMLSDKATMDTFPKLFIANDEVKAAHGASVSSLDTEQLTYLQSRGISRPDAENMVIRGFVHQVAEGVRDPQLRARLEKKLGLEEYLA